MKGDLPAVTFRIMAASSVTTHIHQKPDAPSEQTIQRRAAIAAARLAKINKGRKNMWIENAPKAKTEHAPRRKSR